MTKYTGNCHFLHFHGKIHSKLPIFRVKSVKIYTGKKKFTRIYSWRSWQISGMDDTDFVRRTTLDRKRSTQIARSTTESKVKFIFTRYLNKLFITTESKVTFIFTRYLNKWFHCSDYLSKRLQVWSGDQSTYGCCIVMWRLRLMYYNIAWYNMISHGSKNWQLRALQS